MTLYLDSSALVKLVHAEAESDALRHYLQRHQGDDRVTSVLARVEVVRAVSRSGPDAVAAARAQLERLFLVPLDVGLADDAAQLGGAVLRSLDAVHLASARLLGPALRAVVTYDVRMAAAAAALGIVTVAPA